MSLLEERYIKNKAKQDGQRGHDQEDKRLDETIGKRPPEFNPSDNLLDSQVAKNLNDYNLVNDFNDDIQNANQAKTTLIPPSFLRLGVILLLLLEVVACAEVVKSTGFAQTQQIIIFSFSLAIGLFVLMHITAKVYREKSKLLFSLVLSIYVVVIFALAISRWYELMAVGDDVGLGDLASLIITVVLTIGPAWLCELTLRKLNESTPVAKKLRYSTRQKSLLLKCQIIINI